MLQIAPLRDLQPTFIVVANDVRKTSKSRTKIKLTARPRQFPALDGSKALALITRRKKRRKYVPSQERAIIENAYTKRFFRPLQKYLTQKIKEGHIGPGLPSGTLLIISECGQLPACSVVYNL